MTASGLWLFGLASLSLTYWTFAARAALRLTYQVARVDELPRVTLPRWPRVTLIVPACDEQSTLAAALTARLADDYPELEVIVINDRSRDTTGAIADELARRDPRVRVVHLDALPAGWLGKVHAMDRGAALATGEYLLFSDADTHWRPGTLRRIVARCEAARLDHLTVFPTMRSAGAVLDAATAELTRLLMIAGRPWAVCDPGSSAAFGVGAFNLVRRSSFERAGGFEPLRLEVTDDVCLAALIKQQGGRSEVLRGGEMVQMHLYLNLREYARSAEKMALIFRFRAAPAVVGAAATLLVECAPLLLLALASGLTWWIAALSLVLALAAAAGTARATAQPLRPALWVPLGAAMSAWAMVRAGVLGARQGGLRWRGTFYPAAVLLAGRRVRLG